MVNILFNVIISSSLLYFPSFQHNLSLEKKLAFQYTTNEGVLLDIYGVYNQKNVLEHYTSRIQSPVCKNNECYEVELDFYWDILGNFKKFQPLPDNPLTKLDHQPFTKWDYEHLHTILTDSSPPFMHLKKGQLIEEAPSKERGIDGISGATVTILKDYMIEGAVYTCYTLWHIANGDIEFQLAEYTKQNLQEALIHKLLQSQETEVQYFLIENLKPKYYELFLDELMTLHENADRFLVSRFIQKIPIDLLKSPKVQNYMAKHLNQLDLSSEIRLLKKLNANQILLTDAASHALVDRINSFDFIRNEQIILLIGKQLNTENIYLLENLLNILNKQKITLSLTSFNQLSKWGKLYACCKKTIKKLKTRD